MRRLASVELGPASDRRVARRAASPSKPGSTSMNFSERPRPLACTCPAVPASESTARTTASSLPTPLTSAATVLAPCCTRWSNTCWRVSGGGAAGAAVGVRVSASATTYLTLRPSTRFAMRSRARACLITSNNDELPHPSPVRSSVGVARRALEAMLRACRLVSPRRVPPSERTRGPGARRQREGPRPRAGRREAGRRSSPRSRRLPGGIARGVGMKQRSQAKRRSFARRRVRRCSWRSDAARVGSSPA